MVFQSGQVGSRIAAKAELSAAGFLPIGEVAAELAPLSEVVRPKLQGLEAADAGGDSGDQPDRAADDRAGRRVLAAGSAALVIPRGPEEVLEVVIGAGEIRHVVAVKEARPVAAGHFEEVAHGGT